METGRRLKQPAASPCNLSPVGAVLFNRFPNVARASPDSNLTRRWPLRISLVDPLVRQRLCGHDIGQVGQTHFVPEIVVFLQAARDLQRFGRLIEQRQISLVRDVGEVAATGFQSKADDGADGPNCGKIPQLRKNRRQINLIAYRLRSRFNGACQSSGGADRCGYFRSARAGHGWRTVPQPHINGRWSRCESCALDPVQNLVF